MTQLSKWKIIGYAAAIFAAGGISGGALGVYETKTHLFAPGREQDIATRIERRLKFRLGLSADQLVKIDPIVKNAAAELRDIHRETAQRAVKVFDDTYAQISDILTTEQRAKLDEMKKERREWMQRTVGRWPGFLRPGPKRDRSPNGSPAPAPSAP